MAAFGNIEFFNVSEPRSFESYVERMDFFFTANSITDSDKKKATFLSLCGPNTYEIIRSLVAPAKVSEKTYDEIITELKKHFSPKTSEIVCRFKFYRRNQQTGETISVYLKELRKLAEPCGFGASLDTMLRDRLVCGITDEALQRKLLATDKLKLKDAQDLCIAHEVAVQSLAVLRENESNGNVNAVKFHKQQQTQAKQKSADSRERKKCYRCEKDHSPDSCVHVNSICGYCHKKGHLDIACFMKKKHQNQKRKVHQTTEEITSDNEPVSESVLYQSCDYDFSLNNVTSDSITGKYLVDVLLNKKKVIMEVDSGASYSVISKSTFHTIFSEKLPKINHSSVILRDYQNAVIPTLGECLVEVQRGLRSATLPLIVTEGNRASLLGRNWFERLGLTIAGVSQILSNINYPQEYPDVFRTTLGSYRGPLVSFSLDNTVKPIMFKARKVPFALREKIELELNRLIAQGVLEPITHPKWCTPIVTVCKENGDVRICGDYRSTLNLALHPEPYPVPSVQSILSALAGGKLFAKLDLAQAYLQLSVDRETAEAQTIITHKGAFKCNRLQFGISVAPQIFQKFIDTRLSGISGVLPYYDDILIVGSSEVDLDSKVRAVLSRFQEDGLHLRKEKCVFRTKNIEFLGFQISEDGLRPTKDKIAALTNAPAPTNKTELQAFLGLLNFYHVFLKDKATIANPLHSLLRKDMPWQWRSKEQKAFDALKDILVKEPVLGHYSEQKDLFLTCDASPYGVGCVLSQRDDAGREYPVAYHSRTLSSAERNFAQIDKEALAIITGIKKFHEYVYGRKIAIRTDHKPLLGIFNPRKSVPEILSPRMLRWTLMLSAYDYDLFYVPGTKIQNADALSRLPQKVNVPEPPSSDDVLMLENIPEKIFCAKDIANETKKDPVLSKVLQWAWKGWPDNKTKFSDEFAPYRQRKNEISCYQDCLLWGTRVIVPPGGRKTVLNLLHSAHPGIVKMKSLARSYVWWPNIDKQIENLVNTCSDCQESRNMPKKSPIHPWEWARAPWSRIHLDFAGPFRGKMFLIIIDSYSKWLEVKIVPNTSSAVTIDVLRSLFATHGIPDVIVSDNGTSFTSVEFQDFLKKNLIRQALVAPYHPSSNGQAERMVQNVKNAIKKMTNSNGLNDIQLALHRYLLTQHITPHCATARSPSEILMGRKIGSLFDRLQPDFRKEMLSKQEDQYPNKNLTRCFQENDSVFARSFTPGQKWLPSKIIETTGPLSYKVQIPDGKIVRRHSDQIRTRMCDQETTEEMIPSTSQEPKLQGIPQQGEMEDTLPEVVEQAAEIKRPSARIRKPPKYLEDYEA